MAATVAAIPPTPIPAPTPVHHCLHLLSSQHPHLVPTPTPYSRPNTLHQCLPLHPLPSQHPHQCLPLHPLLPQRLFPRCTTPPPDVDFHIQEVSEADTGKSYKKRWRTVRGFFSRPVRSGGLRLHRTGRQGPSMALDVHQPARLTGLPRRQSQSWGMGRARRRNGGACDGR